ncbi:MAG: radical SAM protein [Thermodesulfobacteriota bacterium]|nr:radical SAM protein [Thermodesulfobacteriota bacterium]
MTLFRKSRFTLEVSIENQEEELVGLYQTMTGAFVLIPEKTWPYALSNPIAPADPATIDLLHEQGFLVKDCVDETMIFESWKQQHVHDLSTLTSKVLVTRKCNNRCRYCILDPEAKDMSRGTALAMDRFYIETIEENSPKKVEDDYLGGEPLLNPKIILESAARRFFFCMGKGIDYSFVITTNGTLIRPSIISDMRDVGLTCVRVSLAGPAPVHDALRPSKHNGKTYELIMENLQAISGMVPISVECQYDSGALDYLKIPEMLDDIAKRSICVDSIAFTPILPRRKRNLYNSGMGDPNIFLYLNREAGQRGYPMNNEAPLIACMADFRSRFVFDTDGSIIPCPSLQGSEMAYGHANTGIDFISESQLLKRALPDRCLKECELLPTCMGGCRLQALTNQNDFGGTDCHYDTYRLLLEEYIRGKAEATCLEQSFVGLKDAA